MKTRSAHTDKVKVVTLGCSKNLVDSEVLMAQLRANGIAAGHDSGFQETPDHDRRIKGSDGYAAAAYDDGSDGYAAADSDGGGDGYAAAASLEGGVAGDPGPERLPNVIIINTCGFIENAKQESINAILNFSGLKQAGRIDKLFVTGCLSERYRTELAAEIPNVDAWFGTRELPALLKRLRADYRHELVGERLLSTPGHFAYLKISEGCNRTCGFCAIPLMRGGHISKPIEQVLEEARGLIRSGVKEIILIAQELTYYGLDLYRRRMLPELLARLADLPGAGWIRLHYAYPGKFPLEVLDVIRDRPNICRYLDIPLQHASDPVLERMRRQVTRAEQQALVGEIRSRVPGIAVRTTMLVGYPGETDEDFETLLEFVRENRFERLGVFTYSHEEGTPAYMYEDDVPAEVKLQRAERLMSVQQEIAAGHNAKLIGREMQVLFDRREGDNFIGRTEYDSPEVDNSVIVDALEHFLRLGDFTTVRITDATEFDLYAEPAALSS